jgi:FMN phosphatase YigB (HAD superfamily)
MNSQEQRIICDVDGCLLNWRSTFIDWIDNFGFLKSDDPTEYDMSKLIKIPGYVPATPYYTEQFSLRLSELFNQSYMLKKLPPIPGAVDSIKELHKAGYKITIVSSYTTDFEAMKSREENLMNVFGPVFQEIVSLPLHSSKKEWLSKQNKNSIFIEDSVKNIKDAIEVGFKPENCYLIPQPYNMGDDDILSFTFNVLSWQDIKGCIG